MTWLREPQFWLRSAGFPLAWIDELAIDDELWSVFDPGRTAAGEPLSPEALENFQARAAAIRAQLAARMQQADFQEAVYLSNPESFERLRALQARLSEKSVNARARQHLRLAWSYMQRLCTKNDTASFFGPIAWGRAKDSCQGLLVRFGSEEWLGKRITNFEHWAIQALADSVSCDPQMQLFLPIRLNPELRVRGREVLSSMGQRAELDPAATALLETVQRFDGGVCEGELLRSAGEQGWDQATLSRWLEVLLRKKLFERGFTIPTVIEQPEQRLRELLGRSSGSAQERWLGLLDELCRLRDAVALANWPERAARMSELNAAFHDALGRSLQRDRGAMYVGRFITYEDCERNVEIEIGEDALRELDRSLAPVLRLYERVTQLACYYVDRAWQNRFKELSSPGKSLPLSQLYPQLAELDERAQIVQQVREIVVAAWQSVIGSRAADVEVSLSESELQSVCDALQIPDADCQSVAPVLSGIHSPDVLLAAASSEAILRGEYTWVLGEVHPGVHTVAQPVARPFCPDPESIEQGVQAHLMPGLLCLADPAHGYQRSHINWPDVNALHEICFRGSTSRVPAERRVPAAEVDVSIEGMSLVARANGLTTPLVAAMPALVHGILFQVAGIVVGGDTRARLTIGKLVLKRRTWVLEPGELPSLERPAESAEDYESFVRWAAAAKLPRRFFVKVPQEPKPIYVDVRSPLSVDLFVKQAAQAKRTFVSEMLPGPGQLWLRDSRGSCTSELRLSYRRVP